MILYYNTHRVSEIIRYHKEMIEHTPFISESFESIFSKYDKLGLTKNNAVYDRSGKLQHFLNIEPSLHPMPKYKEGYNTSFYDVAEKRAKELLAMDQPINVMWSGGIDSTLILFMLGKFANDKDQVRVYGTYNSIIESGDMFDRVIKNNFKYEITPAKRNDMKFNLDGIYVSGMCGNQLFGPTDDMFGTNMLFHHTIGTPDTIYEPYENNVNPELLEFLLPAIKASPRKIETVADLRWYCIFNLDWYTAVYEHRTLLSKEKAEKIYGFFDSLEFQEWAVNTKEPFTKVKGDPNTHRWQMREILSDVFGEVKYAKNKTKKISNFGVTEPSWLFLLSDYRNVFVD
jgi:hypothetical protein